jgi:hypothetical protein
LDVEEEKDTGDDDDWQPPSFVPFRERETLRKGREGEVTGTHQLAVVPVQCWRCRRRLVQQRTVRSRERERGEARCGRWRYSELRERKREGIEEQTACHPYLTARRSERVAAAGSEWDEGKEGGRRKSF